MATPHINAKLEDIAPIVLMPGDPLRAKFIAETFLEDVKEVNNVRNILAYTGNYKGKRVTIFASGMGIPSIGIYAYELYKFYLVETIIRVGSCGAFNENLDLFDLIVVDNSVSESKFAKSYRDSENEIVSSTRELTDHIEKTANEREHKITRGNIFCSESFYSETTRKSELIEKYSCLGVEMETFALFHIAESLQKNASCILTVSDIPNTDKVTTSEEREKGFVEMMKLALESIVTFHK